MPGLGLGAAEAVGEQGEAAVAGPAPLAALLGLGGLELVERQRQRDAELGQEAQVPAAVGHRVEEAERQRRGMGVERRGVAEGARGVGRERGLARGRPQAPSRPP